MKYQTPAKVIIKSNKSYQGDKSRSVIINGIHEFNITRKSYYYDNDRYGNITWKTISELKTWIENSGNFNNKLN